MLKNILDLTSEEVAYYAHSMPFWITGFFQENRRKVLVNGSPKSGTTWVFKLITSLPRYRGVGNFHGDKTRYNSVCPGEVVHGHDRYTSELAQILAANGIRVVLLLRDPRDQLISRVFHIRRDSNHPWHTRLQAVELDEAIMACIEGCEGLPGARSMIELTESWLDHGSDFLLVRYEKLLSDPKGELRRTLDFLGIEISMALLDDIVVRSQFERMASGKKFWKATRKPGQEDPNSHFRKGVVGDWKNYLTEDHIRRFKEVAGDQLIELEYEKNLDW